MIHWITKIKIKVGKKMIQRIQKHINDKNGGGILEFIIIIAIIAILAVTTLPNLNSNITDKAGNAIDRIDSMDDSLDN
jgi:competence protein ComGC